MNWEAVGEQQRFATYTTSVLRRWENLLYQTEHGNFDPDAWSGMREHLRYAFSKPGGTVVWWRRARNLFNPKLQAFIENEFL